MKSHTFKVGGAMPQHLPVSPFLGLPPTHHAKGPSLPSVCGIQVPLFFSANRDLVTCAWCQEQFAPAAEVQS